ncbi:unnamed protein product [Mytilus edulis]|uniref:Uncharacterized protein n=1 Tax=Mytilus edulis TaxID=6550 RepID=A0A8S3VLC2_MYTED|nr:unnamed protein product [Mytilus edulis]
MQEIWKMEPNNWPPGNYISDPRNTKGLTVKKVENFLQILIKCYDDTSKSPALSHEITSEIDTWNYHRSKDNDRLLHLYRTRKCLKTTEQRELYQEAIERCSDAQSEIINIKTIQISKSNSFDDSSIEISDENMVWSICNDLNFKYVQFTIDDGSTATKDASNSKPSGINAFSKRKMANTINKHDTKRTKQRENEGAVDTTPNELFPDRFLGEFLRNNTQDDPLPDMIRKYLPDSLNDAFDDIQC